MTRVMLEPPVRAGPARWSSVVVQALLRLAYPLVILFAWRSMEPRYVGCALLMLLWLQRWLGKGSLASVLRRLEPIDWCVAGLLTFVSAAIAFTDSELLLHLYPSFVSFGLLAAFGATLRQGPTMIEKFARIREPELSASVVRYTRCVTRLWCAFFMLNGAFSVYTALCWGRAAWSLYNGAIVYALIGALLAGEFVWRRWFVLPRTEGSESS